MYFLDPSKLAVQSDEVIFGPNSPKTIAIKGFAAFAIHNVGDVDMVLGNGIQIPAGSQYSDCGLCCLPFFEDKQWKFSATTGNRKFVLVRSKIVEQNAECKTP